MLQRGTACAGMVSAWMNGEANCMAHRGLAPPRPAPPHLTCWAGSAASAAATNRCSSFSRRRSRASASDTLRSATARAAGQRGGWQLVLEPPTAPNRAFRVMASALGCRLQSGATPAIRPDMQRVPRGALSLPATSASSKHSSHLAPSPVCLQAASASAAAAPACCCEGAAAAARCDCATAADTSFSPDTTLPMLRAYGVSEWEHDGGVQLSGTRDHRHEDTAAGAEHGEEPSAVRPWHGMA